MELDAGERFVQPGLKIGYLPQSPSFASGGTVADYVAGGLGADEHDYRVARALDHLSLDGAREVKTLSGGEGRRATLARVLATEPDLMLLDEPTNHLDLPTIEWLEQELLDYSGGVLMISHDRAFLNRLTQRLLWLDRGRMFEHDGGFAEFDDWSQRIIEQESAEAYRLKKRIEQEEYWLQRGVTARRSRNEGRRRNLFALREQRRTSLKAQGVAKLELGEAEAGGKLVIEARDVSKSYTRPDGSVLADREEFLDPDPARRPGWLDRAERRRQDHAAEDPDRRARAGYRFGAARHRAEEDQPRSAPRELRSRSHVVEDAGARRRRFHHGQRTAEAMSSRTCATSCSTRSRR